MNPSTTILSSDVESTVPTNVPDLPSFWSSSQKERITKAISSWSNYPWLLPTPSSSWSRSTTTGENPSSFNFWETNLSLPSAASSISTNTAMATTTTSTTAATTTTTPIVSSTSSSPRSDFIDRWGQEFAITYLYNHPLIGYSMDEDRETISLYDCLYGFYTLGFCGKCILRYGGITVPKYYSLSDALFNDIFIYAYQYANIYHQQRNPSVPLHSPPVEFSKDLQICTCCSGILQGLGLCNFPLPTIASGSCSVLYNSHEGGVGKGIAEYSSTHPIDNLSSLATNEMNMYLNLAKGLTDKKDIPQHFMDTMNILDSGTKDSNNYLKNHPYLNAAESSSNDDTTTGGIPSTFTRNRNPSAVCALTPNILTLGKLSAHLPSLHWMNELIPLVIKGGYDLREGIAISINLSGTITDYENQARSRISAYYGLRKPPYRYMELKECIRMILTNILERIVYVDESTVNEFDYFSQLPLERSRNTTPTTTNKNSSKDVEHCTSEFKVPNIASTVTSVNCTSPVALTVSQAENALGYVYESNELYNQPTPVSLKQMGKHTNIVTKLDELKDTINENGDARLIVASVSDAVAHDFTPLNANQYTLSVPKSISIPIMMKEVDINPVSVQRFGLENLIVTAEQTNTTVTSSSKVSAQDKLTKESKRARTENNNNKSTGNADDDDDDDDDDDENEAFLNLDDISTIPKSKYMTVFEAPNTVGALNNVSTDHALVAMGTTELSSTTDYRLLFDRYPFSPISNVKYTGQMFADSLTPPNSLSATDSNIPKEHPHRNLRRLVVWYGASLKLQLKFDLSLPGFVHQTPREVYSKVNPSQKIIYNSTTVPILNGFLARSSFFVCGRYRKYNRSLSQSPWFIDGWRKASTRKTADETMEHSNNVNMSVTKDSYSSALTEKISSSSSSSTIPVNQTDNNNATLDPKDCSVEELLGDNIASYFGPFYGTCRGIGFIPFSISTMDESVLPTSGSINLLECPPGSTLVKDIYRTKFHTVNEYTLFPSEWNPPFLENPSSILATPRYKFHAAGREDVDVRMLGSGRPYMIEFLDARFAFLPLSLFGTLHNRINTSTTVAKFIQTSPLRPATREEFMLLQAGAAEKRKMYTALVWTSEAQSKESLTAAIDNCTNNLTINQRTPIRVLHRRSLLTRKKIIHMARTDWISPHFFLIHLLTSAGTYIKEFVHGDLGRTVPSIGDLLTKYYNNDNGSKPLPTSNLLLLHSPPPTTTMTMTTTLSSSASTTASSQTNDNKNTTMNVEPSSHQVFADILLLDVTDLTYTS